MFLAQVEESALFLLQHGVVGGFDGGEKPRDVGGFDGHLHVEDEGEGAEVFEGGRGGHGWWNVDVDVVWPDYGSCCMYDEYEGKIYLFGKLHSAIR